MYYTATFNNMNTTESYIRKKLSEHTHNKYTKHYMAPSFRGEYDNTITPKESAVLILLIPHSNSFSLIYIQRTHNLYDKHSGQISFPGGGYSTTDNNLQETAIRETYEEIGIEIEPEWIAGTLSNQYIPISNYNVRPFVAIMPQKPKEYKLQASEISKVIEIPLPHLQNKLHIYTKHILHNGRDIEIPYYAWFEYEIWGATAMITEEFIECITN
ncbi:MAG TPA: CoA pyrophosphatase [Bacteroidales bacterium]|nr:MAG: putative NUDIX hydrolase [Bacteroidetes bacterium ADurb.Bin217]HPM12050.1 CoA pyrophosphatase [Bacteroidales bacterium]